MIKDTKITQLFGIPRSTIQDMKKTIPTNWRYKIYTYLKSLNEDDVKDFFNSQTSNPAEKTD